MRLGGMLYQPETIAEMEGMLGALDTYGLSAIPAPRRILEMTEDEVIEFGQRARDLGLVIGESYFRPNIMAPVPEIRAARIAALRDQVRRSELMGCRAAFLVVGSVGSVDWHLEPHPYMFTPECQAEFLEIVLTVLDGLELATTRLLIEPWNTNFFYQPASIYAFIQRVGHPAFGIHLDQMNMVDQQHYWHTTDLINETFDLLGPYVGGAHLKDIKWDSRHMFLKFDEVKIGDGVLDYPLYLRRLGELDADLTGFCEHLKTEGDYAVNFARLHRIAREAGTSFLRRI